MKTVKKNHGLRKTRIYNIWSNMKDRCYNINNPNYKNYGGRGISVYRDWFLHFKSFYDWSVDNGYMDGLTIERINNDSGYCPNNCKWASRKEQSRNRRTNRFIEYNNEKMTVVEWAEKTGINEYTIYGRLKRGWEPKKALGL